MSIKILGVSHKTAPIAVRERLAVDAVRLPGALRELVSVGGASEALILSTCNRTELYCNDEHDGFRQPLDWMVRYHEIDLQELESHIYTLDQEHAVRHALRVACGLDSMVLGEPQILGQLKQAYRAAVGQGTAGKLLNRLFQHSFFVAKQVRSQTAIGENPVSVAFAAVKLAKQIHGDLSTKKALLIGAGDTISLVANHLLAQNIGEIVIANRSRERSADLAARVDAQAIALTDIPDYLSGADIVVSSTASRLPIITRGAVADAIKVRRNAPMFIVDLAVPRDVEPSAGDLPDIYLYSVDDLNSVVAENSKLREAAANQAEELINLQAQSYMDWLQSQDATQTIIDIRSEVEIAKAALLEKARRRIAAGDPVDETLEHFANSLANRLLHQPLVAIRGAAEDGDDELLKIARAMFSAKNTS